MSIINDVLSTKTLEDLQPTPKAAPKPSPVITTVMVERGVELLREVQKNGGYGDIAETIRAEFNVNVLKSQVKKLHDKMKARIAELTPCGICKKAPCECPEPEPTPEPDPITE